ncbi:unnamed protein product, partial [Rotaria magnacalcarata]
MKLSENTDIIASVVHGELNKALPKDVRRFNTVATSSGREDIVFLAPNVMPRNQAECRGLHAEMQIMKFLKDNGILQDNQINDQNRPIQIGASKPACACCSTAVVTNSIHHKIYANANTNPVN